MKYLWGRVVKARSVQRLGCGLEDPVLEYRHGKEIPLPQNVQTVNETHSASCVIATDVLSQ